MNITSNHMTGRILCALPGYVVAMLLLAAAPALAQTTILPHQQARYAATPEKLGQTQNSIIPDAGTAAQKMFGFAAGDYPEEFRNITIFKLHELGLASSKVARATLEINITHQLGAMSPKITVAEISPTGGQSGFVFNSYDMYRAPAGDALLEDAVWNDVHRIDITEIFKSALDDAGEKRGIAFRVWLDDEGTGELVDYPNREVLKTSLGTVDLKIEVEEKP